LSPGILPLHRRKKITVGKRVGEWVYELFLTTLPVEGFLVEDALDWGLMDVEPSKWCWQMKMSKKIPIAGAPTPSAGRNSGTLRANGSGTCGSRLAK
jgi:hypothetical protein